MAINFSPCLGSYVLDQFPSIVMSGMKGFHLSASGAIQGHHGPLGFFFFYIICTTHCPRKTSTCGQMTEYYRLGNPCVAGYRYMVIYREANRHVVRKLSGRVHERYS